MLTLLASGKTAVRRAMAALVSLPTLRPGARSRQPTRRLDAYAAAPRRRNPPFAALTVLGPLLPPLAEWPRAGYGNGRRRPTINKAASPERQGAAAPDAAADFVTVAFYGFADVADPHLVVQRHRDFVLARDIRCRIYINEQGINAQLSGPRADALAYSDWARGPGGGVGADGSPLFAGSTPSVEPAPRGHAFPRATLRYKTDLVQMGLPGRGLPLTDPAMRAAKLPPAVWREALAGRVPLIGGVAGTSDSKISDSVVSRPLVVDVRNDYEWDAGHFLGAARPNVSAFRETDYEAPGGPLHGVDKDAPVMLFCTGGIRCDVYSAVLKQKGFTNLYSLEGGVARYLKEVPSVEGWTGSLFVFDARLAAGGAPQDSEDSEDSPRESRGSRPRCHCCGAPRASPPHRNCPNVDCNRLFLICPACLASGGGFCAPECEAAVRVRPALLEPGYYGPLSDFPAITPEMIAARRGGGRLLRRRRRRERLKAARIGGGGDESGEGGEAVGEVDSGDVDGAMAAAAMAASRSRYARQRARAKAGRMPPAGEGAAAVDAGQRAAP